MCVNEFAHYAVAVLRGSPGPPGTTEDTPSFLQVNDQEAAGPPSYLWLTSDQASQVDFTSLAEALASFLLPLLIGTWRVVFVVHY